MERIHINNPPPGGWTSAMYGPAQSRLYLGGYQNRASQNGGGHSGRFPGYKDDSP